MWYHRLWSISEISELDAAWAAETHRWHMCVLAARQLASWTVHHTPCELMPGRGGVIMVGDGTTLVLIAGDKQINWAGSRPTEVTVSIDTSGELAIEGRDVTWRLRVLALSIKERNFLPDPD